MVLEMPPHADHSIRETTVLRISREKLFLFDPQSDTLWYEVCLADTGGQKNDDAYIKKHQVCVDRPGLFWQGLIPCCPNSEPAEKAVQEEVTAMKG